MQHILACSMAAPSNDLLVADMHGNVHNSTKPFTVDVEPSGQKGPSDKDAHTVNLLILRMNIMQFC
jgi:hypothetical protein